MLVRKKFFPKIIAKPLWNVRLQKIEKIEKKRKKQIFKIRSKVSP